MRILIVDDERTLRDALVLKLKEYDLDVAVDGLEAIEKLQNNSYDLLLLDIMMPKLDGLAVLRSTKTPTVVLTNDKTNEVFCKDFPHCKAYFIKSSTPINIIAEWIKNNK